MENERLKKQLEFLLTLDRLKNVYRQTYILCDDLPQGSREFDDNFKEKKPLPRRENDAEHSFSLAIAAAVLAEYSNEPVDVAKVMKMVLVHDAVEIYAGDTYCYDDEGAKTKEAREKAAAVRCPRSRLRSTVRSGTNSRGTTLPRHVFPMRWTGSSRFCSTIRGRAAPGKSMG